MAEESCPKLKFQQHQAKNRSKIPFTSSLGGSGVARQLSLKDTGNIHFKQAYLPQIVRRTILWLGQRLLFFTHIAGAKALICETRVSPVH